MSHPLLPASPRLQRATRARRFFCFFLKARAFVPSSGDSPQIAPSAEAVWDLYVSSAGPVKTLAGALPPDRREALRRAFVSLVDAHRDHAGIRFSREYLLVLGQRR